MEQAVRREEASFLSTDGHTQVHAVLWWPDQEPKAVVQLVHGMAEHIMRYEPFARYLCARGFAVCGHDHVGHGRSVDDASGLGCLPVHGGRDVLVGDVGRMRAVMRRRVDAACPHFLFGHSMGSFVVRAYIADCAQGLAGAIICGTGHIPPATSAAGNVLARLIARVRGEDYVSRLLGEASVGAYTRAIPDARTPLDWLSYDEGNVDAYLADDLCGFAFSAGGNATLMALTGEVCAPACFARIPSQLPLLFVAGDADPVGNMGEGVRTAAQMATDAGVQDVTCTIYEHMRHEILNEADAPRVMEHIATWMEERL